jgi:hypothetical protein
MFMMLLSGDYEDALAEVKTLWLYVGAKIYATTWPALRNYSANISNNTDPARTIQQHLTVSDEALVWVIFRAKLAVWRTSWESPETTPAKRGRKKVKADEPSTELCGKTADYARIVDHITTCRQSAQAKGWYTAMADKMAEDRQEVSSNSAPDASNGISNDEQGQEIWSCEDVVPAGGYVVSV